MAEVFAGAPNGYAGYSRSIDVPFHENKGREPIIVNGHMKLLPHARIIRSSVGGPLYLEQYARLGPDSRVGRYCSLGFTSWCSRADVGSFVACGPRTVINPFNHPVDWLSTHEVCYNPTSYDWVSEYAEFAPYMAKREAAAFARVSIGSDVWLGANCVVLRGISIDHGAIIGAGTVVTKHVPPYAVVVGSPARTVKYRFRQKVIDRLLVSRWWDLPLSDLRGLDFSNVESCLERVEDIRRVKIEAEL